MFQLSKMKVPFPHVHRAPVHTTPTTSEASSAARWAPGSARTTSARPGDGSRAHRVGQLPRFVATVQLRVSRDQQTVGKAKEDVCRPRWSQVNLHWLGECTPHSPLRHFWARMQENNCHPGTAEQERADTQAGRQHNRVKLRLNVAVTRSKGLSMGVARPASCSDVVSYWASGRPRSLSLQTPAGAVGGLPPSQSAEVPHPPRRLASGPQPAHGALNS